MKTLYFDCFAGASGDMILGALVDLGVDPAALKARLEMLTDDRITVEFSKVERAGTTAVKADVEFSDQIRHRHLRDIEGIIDRASVSATVKDRSKSIFRRLAEAEAKIHGCDVSAVHFHEVGAVDAIVDVVGACLGFEMLEIGEFACSTINVGSGSVKMSHGIYPIPAPAVADLVKGVPVRSEHAEGELLTPTGAAIITTLCSSYGRLPEMTIEATGYGAGSRSYENFPNVLRLVIGETSIRSSNSGDPRIEELVLLETNLDDCTPQELALMVERAHALGALDCWVAPVQMKKGRPGFVLSILCSPDKESDLKELLFRETTTIGVRISRVQRESLSRSFVTVKTDFGEVRVKVSARGEQVMNVMPEFEDVKAAALINNAPFRTVQQAALKAYELLTASPKNDEKENFAHAG
jgi:pyridinium-3,5-bisthiocarboxylic acid mononucleotide nickel chelatase